MNPWHEKQLRGCWWRSWVLLNFLKFAVFMSIISLVPVVQVVLCENYGVWLSDTGWYHKYFTVCLLATSPVSLVSFLQSQQKLIIILLLHCLTGRMYTAVTLTRMTHVLILNSDILAFMEIKLISIALMAISFLGCIETAKFNGRWPHCSESELSFDFFQNVNTFLFFSISVIF